MAEMLSTDVGQSASLRTVSPDRLHQILMICTLRPTLQSIREPAPASPNSAMRILVVWGQYAKFGDQIRIDATLAGSQA